MSVDWRPRDTTPAEDARALLMAVGAGAAVGAVTFWLARTLLGRDAVQIEPPALERRGAGADRVRGADGRRTLGPGDAGAGGRHGSDAQ